MFTRLQPILFVRDLASEVAFYRQLGFQVPHQEEAFAAIAYEDSILFGLQVRPDSSSHNPGEALVWQIGVASVQAIHALCESEGLPILQPPTLEDWGDWTTAVRSPSGHRVVFEGPR
jgi:catechol 2,3-dioxygenase-like lactoylglutathione lyase family enzyme